VELWARDVTDDSHAVPPCRLTDHRSPQSHRRPPQGLSLPSKAPVERGAEKQPPMNLIYAVLSF